METIYKAEIILKFEIALTNPDRKDAQAEYDNALKHIQKNNFLFLKECSELKEI